MLNSCKKTYFATQKAADFYIEKLQKSSNRQKVPVNSYLCPKCNLWHLSSAKTHEKSLIDCLKAKIIELEKEVKQLKSENLLLQQHNNKEENIIIKRDAIRKQAVKNNEKLQEQLRKLRFDNSSLIAENYQLKKMKENENEK